MIRFEGIVHIYNLIIKLQKFYEVLADSGGLPSDPEIKQITKA